MREIREGINDTGVKAAFLKCAVEKGGLSATSADPAPERRRRRSRPAVPLMVHTSAPARTAPAAARAPAGHGVRPAGIVIARAGDSKDLDYLRALPTQGAEPGLRPLQDPTSTRTPTAIETLAALVAEGYADRIHLGHDGVVLLRLHVGQPAVRERAARLPAHPWRSSPRCSSAGVAQAHIDELLVDNPQRFFGV